MITRNSALSRKKRLFYAFVLLSFLIIASINIFRLILIPKEINIITGKEERFEFNLPADAVVLSTDKPALSLDGKTLSDNDKISLSHPFSISSSEECSAKMLLRFMGIPIKEVSVSAIPDTKLVPGGNVIGVRINTDGIMVLGIGSVKDKNGDKISPCDGLLKAGDLIIKADGKAVETKEELIKAIEESQGEKISLSIKRDGKTTELEVKPAEDEGGKKKLAVWVRDSTQGVGTLTYYNPDTKTYGALGHGINDVDTKSLMSVKNGKIMNAEVYDVSKSEKGSPGEILGNIKKNEIIGTVFANTEYGIFGEMNQEGLNTTEKALPIALHSQVKEGPVKILSCLDGTQSRYYDAEIISINRYNINSPKGLVIRITDKELLSKTNGIVQGMSGSPIIQDGKLVGAVTHVFINSPDKGYGIFIENMLKHENQEGEAS